MKEIGTLASSVESSVSEMLKGLEFIPEKKRNWKPEESAKSAHEVANHVSYWNHFFEKALTGSKPPAGEPEWIAANKELKTGEGVRQTLEKTGSNFAKAVKALKPEHLSKEIELPWGTSSAFQVALINYNHVSYHAGQLNYMQTLLGDTESH